MIRRVNSPLFLLPLTLCLLPSSSSASALSTLAAQMKPGEWKELTTNNIVPVLGQAAGGATGNILPYTDDMVWNPNSHEMYFIGSDHQHATGYARFVVYKETTNTWTELPRPTYFQPLTETAMHGYDHSAINQKTGEIYHRPFGAKRAVNRYYVPTNSWRAAFNIPTSLIATDAEMSCCIGVEFFPEYNGIIFVDDGNGSGFIYTLSFKTAKWNMLKSGLAMGPYHNVAEYNPVYKVVVGGGGNGSSDLYKIDSTGAVTTQKKAPITFGINESIFTVDPLGGDYLVFNNAHQFWSYRVDTDTWHQESGTVPIFTGNNTSGVAAAPLSTYGVVWFTSCEGANSCRVTLYKRTAGSAVETARQGVDASAIRASPNPFAATVAFQVGGGHSGNDIEIGIYNLKGEQVSRFLTGSDGRAEWNAGGVPAGVYLARTKNGNQTLTERIVLRK